MPIPTPERPEKALNDLVRMLRFYINHSAQTERSGFSTSAEHDAGIEQRRREKQKLVTELHTEVTERLTEMEVLLLQRAQEIEQVKAERDSWRAAERSVSDAYLRVRQLLGAFNTKPGGTDRFEVTEQAIRNLKVKADAAPLPASAALQAEPEIRIHGDHKCRECSMPLVWTSQGWDCIVCVRKERDELEAALSRADQEECDGSGWLLIHPDRLGGPYKCPGCKRCKKGESS